jgi:NO-binding membrane sensor protein with MHYT domain
VVCHADAPGPGGQAWGDECDHWGLAQRVCVGPHFLFVMNKVVAPPVTDTTETFLLLWALAALVAILAGYVGLGWLQRAQRNPVLRQAWPQMLIAGATLGTGVCGSSVLMLAGEPLSFQLGFDFVWAFGLWLGAVAGCTLVAWLLTRGERWWGLLGSALLMAVVISLVQYGWIHAVGFRPALKWKPEIISGAVIVVLVAVCIAVWVSCSDPTESSRRRSRWRFGAAIILALGLVAGQEVMNMASALLKAKGSINNAMLPISVLSLVCGVLLPMVLGGLAVDLAIRSKPKRKSRSTFAPKPRSRRRVHEEDRV